MIDGSGDVWWQALKEYFELSQSEREAKYPESATDKEKLARPYFRPRLIEPVRCRNVVIEGVTLQNSGYWTLHLLFCEDVNIRGLTVRNPYWAYNADGITPVTLAQSDNLRTGSVEVE